MLDTLGQGSRVGAKTHISCLQLSHQPEVPLRDVFGKGGPIQELGTNFFQGDFVLAVMEFIWEGTSVCNLEHIRVALQFVLEFKRIWHFDSFMFMEHMPGTRDGMGNKIDMIPDIMESNEEKTKWAVAIF